jgi:hypothetical protein
VLFGGLFALFIKGVMPMNDSVIVVLLLILLIIMETKNNRS